LGPDGRFDFVIMCTSLQFVVITCNNLQFVFRPKCARIFEALNVANTSFKLKMRSLGFNAAGSTLKDERERERKRVRERWRERER
jgi:hypothetical protein